MTRNEKKEWLSRAYHLDRRIKTNMRRAEGLLSLATRATTIYSEAGCHGLGDATSRLEDAAVKLADISTSISNDTEELEKVLTDIRSAIDGVGDATAREILVMRYLDMMRWEDISSNLSLSVDYTYQLHRKALGLLRIE